MHFESVRPFTLVCVAMLLAGCDADRLVSPSLSIAATGPTAPSNVTATAVSSSRVDVAWQDNSADESGFEVYGATTGLAGFSLWTTTGPDATTWDFTGIEASREYCFQVRAFTKTGRGKKITYSAFSAAACATTPPPRPRAPAYVSASPGTSTSVWITWTGSPDADGFRLQRSTDDGASWTTFHEAAPYQSASWEFGATPESPQRCYRVIAFNEHGDSEPSNVDCTTPPAGPSNLTASVRDDQAIALTWVDNSSIEDGYQVLRGPLHAGPVTPIASLPANATSYRDAGASPDVTYAYYVRATKDGGNSDNSDLATATAASGPPSAPSGTDAAASSSTTIDVQWSDDSGNEDGFRVERSTDGGATWVPAVTTGPSGWRVTDGDRTLEQRTCYRVVAFNGKGDSAPSNTDCTSTTAGPTDLVATVVDYQTVDLTWTDNSDSEDGYYIERWAGWQESWFPHAWVPANTTRLTDLVPEAGRQYVYRVTAVKDGGYADYSNEVWVYVP